MKSPGEIQVTLDELRARVSSFPKLPGVYLMRDEGGAVLYVGKARDLRARVRTYFGAGDGRSQIAYLMRRVAAVEKIVTQTEEQAFILERDLISKYRPRYNIRLKDDKAYLSVRIDLNAPWPRLDLVRRIENDGAEYFGPFVSSAEIRALLDVIKRVVPLRTCSNTVFFNRVRPCLEYQIKRCCGPCCLPVAREEYLALVKQAIALLQGKSEALMKELNAKMDAAANDLRFEEAAVYRDRVAVLEASKRGAPLNLHSFDDRDVFVSYREESLATVALLKVRNGRIADNQNFAFDDVQITDEELLEGVVSQYYDKVQNLPTEVIVGNELTNALLLERGLRARAGQRVELIFPQRGVRARLVEIARLNARQHFVATFEGQSIYQDTAASLAALLKLKQVPRRIECVDISNLQGSDIVGACVVFMDGQPDRSAYRRYKLSTQGKPDDFTAIHEVVYRRLRRGIVDGTLPDLLIVDGGAGQLAAACRARDELRLELEVRGLAKMRPTRVGLSQNPDYSPERVFFEFEQEALPLEEGRAVTNLLKRIRDEVHRFVITFHRSRRKQRVLHSVLSEVHGVGPISIQRLLVAYKSPKRIATLSIDEIARCAKCSQEVAARISTRCRSLRA